MQQAVEVTNERANCRNCDAALTGKFCSNCGQRDRGGDLDASELASEAVDSIVRIDSKLWRTLVELTKNPGAVAKNYANGMRARYVNPLRYCFATVAISIAATIYTGEFDAISERVVFETAIEAAEDPFVRDLNSFILKYLNLMSLLAVPIYALVLKLLTRRSGYSYASHFSFVCFVLGHGALLGVLGTLFNSYIYFLGLVPSLIITNFIYIYGAMRFYDRGIWVSSLLISAAFTSYVGLIFGLVSAAFMLGFLG
ncbi:DUF3667 domain-containing protein [Kordiimonas sp.]|uniref:DUF3667 domain-containing protein n=1 Tax=Kordiimonas sp. TaxID=1970157 RepID=UPI003A934656